MIKYYTKPDGTEASYYKEGFLEIENPVRADGTLLPQHKNIDTVETDTEGNFYTVYLQDGTQDAVAIQTDIDAEAVAEATRVKVEALDDLIITANTVAYDANGKAVGNMSAVVSLAAFKFNQTIAGGIATDVAYQTIYKDTTIGWKGADNTIHTVQIESICEALEVSMLNIATIIGV